MQSRDDAALLAMLKRGGRIVAICAAESFVIRFRASIEE